MTDRDSPPATTPKGVDRKERLAEALRANLHRRKAQARSRRHNNEEKAKDKGGYEGDDA